MMEIKQLFKILIIIAITAQKAFACTTVFFADFNKIDNEYLECKVIRKNHQKINDDFSFIHQITATAAASIVDQAQRDRAYEEIHKREAEYQESNQKLGQQRLEILKKINGAARYIARKKMEERMGIINEANNFIVMDLDDDDLRFVLGNPADNLTNEILQYLNMEYKNQRNCDCN